MIPWVFANVKPYDAYAIIEMASFALSHPNGSITYEITPDVAVVTSLAPAHIGNHGSLEGVAKAKSNIFCAMTEGSYAVINRDMPYYEIFEARAKSFKLNIITFGTHPKSVVRMSAVENANKFSVMGKTYKLDCPVPTEQLYDVLAVVGVSIAIGFSIDKTLEYLKDFRPVTGRGNILKANHDGKSLTVINSAFNANPFSMKYALEHLKTIEPNRKSRVAILGDISELGDGSIDYHKGLADAMIDAETDRLLLCGNFMRYPYEMIRDKVNVIWFETLAELLNAIEVHLRDGDTVLIKSSHSTGLSELVALLGTKS